MKLYRMVALDRILAIDPLGDGYFPVPHVFVEFDENGPFTKGDFPVLERAGMGGHRIELEPIADNRVRMFPKALPLDFAVSPKQFDDTGVARLALSVEAKAKLQSLLASPAGVNQRRTLGAADADRAERARSELNPFRRWRDSVARPLFSTFVRRLRAAGHGARVVLRSIEPGSGLEASDSVELRVQLRASQANPSYHPSGHVRLSTSEYAGWRLDVWPAPDTPPRSGHGTASPTVENMGQKELEGQVLAMLERLTSRGY